MSDPQIYTIGWISALPIESAAAQQFLDERHEPPEFVSQHDNNVYVLGKVGRHNVVMANVPKGEYGTTTAATVAKDMLHSFPNVRIGLMVGIGGGAPSAAHDIRLGDIVVSTRDDGQSGVFQYDFGKTIQDQTFHYTQHLNHPPQILLTAVGALESRYMADYNGLDSTVRKVLEQKPRLRRNFSQPPASSGRLYRSGFVHRSPLQTCSNACGDDPEHLVTRPERGQEDDNTVVHYGVIASANQLMKDALIRDKLAAEKGVLCFEMEAAGLMNHFPCLVVRGICDYADSHKNKEWQGYAAMIASAYTKEVLEQIPPNKVEAESRILETIGRSVSKIEQTTLATQVVVDQMGSQLHCDKIKSWLRPPDPSINLNHARKLRHKGTGTWLLNKPFFHSWCSGLNRHLWLHGFAGCGKTVLSATILDHLTKTYDELLLRFYFDFSDGRKQTLDCMLRSLAFQIRPDQPSTKALSEVVRKMLTEEKDVCVILDALDESTTRDELLRWIEDTGSDPKLHHVRLLYTSRPEPDLQQGILANIGQESCFPIDTQALNEDIRSFVTWQLTEREDFKGRKLSEDLVELIRIRIGEGSDGMFRWAACQMDDLAKCLNPKMMRNALNSLPKDLAQTYERMLQSIPENLKNSAKRLLQFLVHSKRPLTLQEAKEIIATNIDVNPSYFDAECRVFEDRLVLQYAPGLLSIVEVNSYGITKELHLAHFSVKEFLEHRSDFGLPTASNVITRTCLTYLKDITSGHDDIEQDFPMARFAAKTWTSFGASAEAFQDTLEAILTFLEGEATLERWCRLCEPGRRWGVFPGAPTASRLYYACQAGLPVVARVLIDKGADVDAVGENCSTGLQAASREGHYNVVKLLIDEGADVNDPGRIYGNALQAASFGDHYNIVKLLLDKGADVNAQSGRGDWGTALNVASSLGRYEVVKLLLENGADANAEGGYGYSTALKDASVAGHYEIAKLLLEKGADVNPSGNYLRYGTALQDASRAGHYEIVKLLLEKGADINAPGDGWDYGTALQDASRAGHYEIVKLLLEKGADVNALGNGWRYGTALQDASRAGHYEIVKLLLEKGADVNAPGNGWRTEQTSGGFSDSVSFIPFYF
ncbi:nacht and ankyrin [Fusarium sporotrichioides]|uniref:Nacht and ankyrin n=1 Tax=Fusarium sporotrichioides TaxID=5514 RepID=A0A395SBJ8_FUSSP|nr:nacht and ankyrin [Fusarium sporotrichioides]